jgi:opacity protein-like surface antigen
MKNILTAITLIFAGSTAYAASLPEKSIPAAPTKPLIEAPASWYVGANAGGNVRSNQNVQYTPGNIGGVVGYNFNKNFALEVTLDQAFKKGHYNQNTRAIVNGVVSSPYGVLNFTPYILAGVGTQTKDIYGGASGLHSIYNVGGGVKYEVNNKWDIDARYRYVNTFSDSKYDSDAHIFTVGTNFKF